MVLRQSRVKSTRPGRNNGLFEAAIFFSVFAGGSLILARQGTIVLQGRFAPKVGFGRLFAITRYFGR